MNIQEVSTVKYLGVTFDSNLTWKNHVNELCLKLSKTVGIFSKLRYYVNVDILIMLYYSLIYPFLTLVRGLSAKFWRDLYRADKSTKLCMVVA